MTNCLCMPFYWERLQIRDCNYRNHRIFTLKCIIKSLVPVSIKLKTTIKTEKPRKIIRKVERDLLQAGIQSINRLLQIREGNITLLVPTRTPGNSTFLAVSSISLQADSTSPQASTIIIAPRQLVIPRQGGSINIVSASQAGRQVIGSFNPQTVSTTSKGARTVPTRQVVPRQTALIPKQ